MHDELQADYSGGKQQHWGSKKSQKSVFAKFNRTEFYFLIFVLFLVAVSVCAILLLAPSQTPSSTTAGSAKCTDECRLQLVETIPDNLTYSQGSPVHLDTYESWLQLIDGAAHTIDIGSYYWTLRQEDVIADASAWKGEDIFKKLLDVGTGTHKIRIAQNNNSDPEMMLDTEILAREGAANVRTLDFPTLLGGGIIHAKFWLTDSSSFYVGSANLDWRALTQVKELGIMVTDCSCMGKDLQKIFDAFWMMGKQDAVVPSEWPKELDTNINMENPIVLESSGLNETMYISVAPPAFLPDGRSSDLTAVLNIIDLAKEFVYIAVMDYFPTTLYQKKNIYWPLIDDRLRAAAFERGVQVRLLASWWKYSSSAMKDYLRSLESINDAVGGSVEVKLFEVPVVTPSQAEIPYSRVNHNKYMVTDTTALITTSNWSGDYFINTAGVSVVVSQTDGSTSSKANIHVQLKAVFDRDWYSPYAKSIDALIIMSRRECVELNNGTMMPLLGLGTFKMKDEVDLEQALDCAIRNGYRLIDTAAVYHNEHLIGRCFPSVLARHGLKRHDIFITTKLGPKCMDPAKVRPALEASLEKLNLDYVDLFLIHWPAKQGMRSDDSKHAVLRKQCWNVLEDIYRSTSQIKAIGVSNYTSRHMEELLSFCNIRPAVLQSEFHPDHMQQDLRDVCRNNGIHFQAYSSLGSGKLVGDERFCVIASGYARSVSQILLRWAIEKGCSVIPKSVNKDHIAENSKLFDFSLTRCDIEEMEALTIGTKYCWDPSKVA